MGGTPEIIERTTLTPLLDMKAVLLPQLIKSSHRQLEALGSTLRTERQSRQKQQPHVAITRFSSRKVQTVASGSQNVKSYL